MNRRRLYTTIALAAATLALGQGCAVSSGRASYIAHTGHRVSAGVAGSPNVAVAFGLDGHRTESSAVAQVDPD